MNQHYSLRQKTGKSPSAAKKRDILPAFLGRSISGLLYIYCVNGFCLTKGISTHVSLNPATALLSGFLGIPGAMMAYGIKLWSLL